MAQVAQRIVDSHDDPVFRNGLMVYIKQLRKGTTLLHHYDTVDLEMCTRT